jgi:hypothetical protein
VGFVPVGVDGELVGVTVHADEALHADAQACLLQNFPFARLSHGLARLHAAAGQAPLTVVLPFGEQDASLFVEDGGGTAKAEFALFCNALAIEDLGHG